MREWLAGKSVVVTGGGRGIGKAIAELFASEGAHVVIMDVSESLLKEACGELERNGRRCLGIACDVTDQSSVQEAVKRAEAEAGPVGVLVNNAAIGYLAPVQDTELNDWQRVLDVNLTGAFLLTREVLRAGMLERGDGSIVNISSKAGVNGIARYGAYAASKAGLIAFTKSLALELHDTKGINVNAVCPSEVDTEMNRKSHPGEDRSTWATPAEVAEVVLFLASPEARLLKGTIVEAYGQH